MSKLTIVPTLAAGLLSTAILIDGARAETVEAFYRGKTISLLIPSAAGGGYDRFGRLMGRHIGHHIPGNPTIVPRNIPGAGGVIQANQLYTSAPKDGTAFGIIQHSIPLRPIFDPREVRYKVDGFRWLGSMGQITTLAVVSKSANIKSVDEIFKREIAIGATGGTTAYLPATVNTVLGAKFKMISGYKSTSEVLLAMERKEVEGIVGIGVSSLAGSTGGATDNLSYLFQMGYSKHPSLPDVPLVQAYAKNDEDKSVMEAIFASLSIGRSFVTPVIPEDRLAELRAAFKATMSDPAFVSDAEKSKAEVGYVPPEEIMAIITRVYGLPKRVLDRAAEAFKGASQ